MNENSIFFNFTLKVNKARAFQMKNNVIMAWSDTDGAKKRAALKCSVQGINAYYSLIMGARNMDFYVNGVIV